METIIYKPLNTIWLKASVVGSIWAAIEIILGSFLHNMKIPFSGMLLSFISVWLLISFMRVWKENGLIWRAGIICALMKSISPSAFILGPMIGIFTEAVLIELVIFLFGKNLLGYLIGGSLAVLSTIIHKLVSLLILYGFDLIKILTDLYQFTLKQVDLEQVRPIYLILLVTGIYILTGIAGTIAGYITGSKYINNRKLSDNHPDIILSPENKLSDQSTDQQYSFILLTVNILSIITILYFLNTDFVIITILSSILYLVFCIYNYKSSLKRLKKFSFWISFIIITFAAAFLWNGFSQGAFFSVEGLIIGLKMNARAIILVIGFASLSVELKNPVIKSVLYHRGFANLYQSLTLAFSALPFFISNISKPGNNKKRMPGIKFQGILVQAETLFRMFQEDHSPRPDVVIITGEIHQGKTTFAKRIIDGLVSQNFDIAGFLSIGVDVNGNRTGFVLQNLTDSEQTELCSKVKENNRLKLGQYYFNNDTIIKGLDILSPDKISGKQLIVIDEIGALELNNGGWNNAIENLSRNTSIPHLWVIRRSLVKRVVRKWDIGNVYIFDISNSGTMEVENTIKKIIQ